MYYRSSFRSRRPRHSSYKAYLGMAAAIAALAGLFAYGIWWFRFAPKDSQAVADPNPNSQVLAPSPVSSAALSVMQNASNRASLRDVTGGSSSGDAEREPDADRFSFSAKAGLPEIDREAYAYEGWLLRQVPYDYFSVGEFVTNDAGEWVLEWEGVGGKYDAYTQVVVTLEKKDGNADPSGHVLEGGFE